jgi:hypothetical protein
MKLVYSSCIACKGTWLCGGFIGVYMGYENIGIFTDTLAIFCLYLSNNTGQTKLFPCQVVFTPIFM